MLERCAEVKGPLGPFTEGFFRKLGCLGCKPLSAGGQLALLGQLSEWLGLRSRSGGVDDRAPGRVPSGEEAEWPDPLPDTDGHGHARRLSA